jgi:hypothetical protein
MSVWIQATAAAIVLIYLLVKVWREPNAGQFLTRMALLAAAAWIAEDSVIAAYGFYSYNPHWSFFLHHVPLLIALIWPVVIHSAGDLAMAVLGRRHRLVPLLAGAIVFSDAALIEPVAVHAGLWTWHEPGPFGVPVIGVLGWALFAGLCVACFCRPHPRLALLGAPLATHVLLLVSWWAALRWVSHPMPAWPLVVTVWLSSITLSWLIATGAIRARLPRLELLLRAPAALFFFALLACSPQSGALWLYALAFAPPYFVLLCLSKSR